MIICPNCKNEEMTGAIYCSNCGAQLTDLAVATQKVDTTGFTQVDEAKGNPVKPPAPVHLKSRLSLTLVEGGQVLPLVNRVEYTLGRSVEGQPILPDVDLTSYNAYAYGVSRLHAVMKIVRQGVIIMDLGSFNGTFVNGERLEPFVETAVVHGDLILLGRLRLQVLIG
jgi:FHA domain